MEREDHKDDDPASTEILAGSRDSRWAGSVRQVLLSAPALTAWLVAIPLFLVGRRWTGLRSSTPVVSARSGALCACSAALIALAAAPIKRGVLHGGTSVLAEQVLVAWIEEARGRITDQQLAWSGIAESLRDAVALDASAPDRVLASFWQWHPQRERWPNADFGVARPLVRELEPEAMHTLALRERLGLPVEGPIHVIILFLESVRAFEMEHPALGPKVFPRTRALLGSHALRFPTAYASAPHAAKTVQGQFTTLCSLLPGPSGGAVYLWYPNVRVKCLAEVAREHGYHTLWISGGTEDFQKKRLFESLHGTDAFFGAEYLASIPYKGRQFECGYPDGPMLQEAVRILEREAQDGRPVFANVLTLSTHHPVSEIPEGPVPATLRAAAKRGPADKDYVGYLSRLRYLDESLASFFDTLFASPIGDRTLVVMLGDHGARYKPHIPVAQHQVVELMARIPLAIVTKGLRAPSVSSYPVHQVDVAPTVADIHRIPQHCGLDWSRHPRWTWLTLATWRTGAPTLSRGKPSLLHPARRRRTHLLSSRREHRSYAELRPAKDFLGGCRGALLPIGGSRGGRGHCLQLGDAGSSEVMRPGARDHDAAGPLGGPPRTPPAP